MRKTIPLEAIYIEKCEIHINIVIDNKTNNFTQSSGANGTNTITYNDVKRLIEDLQTKGGRLC